MLHFELLCSLCYLLFIPVHYLTSEIRDSETDACNCIHALRLFIDLTYSPAPLRDYPMEWFNTVQP